jgi:glucokinase
VTLHLGIDLGVTNLKWSVVEAERGSWRTIDQGAVATEATDGPDAVIGRLAAIGRAALDQWGTIATVGIGVPGLYDPSSGSTRFLVNMPGDWLDRPVAPPLEAALRVPVALINDARAFGLAELRLGAGRGVGSLVGLTLGTGIGGVIAIDGRVHLGHDGTAGEVGHQTIDVDGDVCGCGNRGCLETFARADRIAAACGTATVTEAVEAAGAGDAQALAGFAAVGRYLGIGIANLIVLFSPDRVVIGGGVAAAGDLLFRPIRQELRERVRTTSLAEVEVVPAELGTWAGSIGAAIHGAEARAGAVGALRAPADVANRPEEAPLAVSERHV